MKNTNGTARLRLRLGIAAAVAGSLALAGCGGGTSADPAASASAGADLVSALGIAAGENLGEGKSWTLGAALPMSGPGAPEGKEMKQAIDLAIDQIAAAGGPSIKLSVKDIKGPDPVAAKQAARELAAEGVAGKITTYGDGLGAMLADTGKDKILSLDGVGGAQSFAQGAPYFYGPKAVAPGDALPGALEWFKKAHPQAASVGLVGWDLGPFNEAVKAEVVGKIEASGLKFNGLWETTAPSSQDFASVIGKVKANQPDMLLLGMGAQAPGAFTAQANAAGLDSLLMGIEFTQTAVDASKGQWDKNGFHFAVDYFDAENPANPLADLFVNAYEARYKGQTPSFYAANAYEETLMFWDLIRRTLASGGDISSGADLLKALESNPEFDSLYGGDADTVGSVTLDLTTHGVASRPMGVYEYKDGKVTPLATYDIGAAKFTQP